MTLILMSMTKSMTYNGVTELHIQYSTCDHFCFEYSCLGSYSESSGIELIRKNVANFIYERDGVCCDYKNVYLVNGASEGIKTMLYVVMGDECSADATGVMIPTPQYPLYTAALAELGACPVSTVHERDVIFEIQLGLNPDVLNSSQLLLQLSY